MRRRESFFVEDGKHYFVDATDEIRGPFLTQEECDEAASNYLDELIASWGPSAYDRVHIRSRDVLSFASGQADLRL